ncbi:sulfotransferase family protein [Rhodovibrionaceae bacterium A322]
MTVPSPSSASDVEFFLLGAGRGGTSLLTGLLDFHPQLEVGYEAFAGSHLAAPRDSGSSTTGERDARMASFLKICKEEAEKHPGKIWGNKLTTEHLFRSAEQDFSRQNNAEETLRAFLNQVVDQRKLIFVLRDGRAAVLSKMQRANRSIEEACWRWRFSVLCYRYLKDTHRECHLLRFEDLLADPQNELQKICDYLGLPFDVKMLEGFNSPKIPSFYKQQGIVSEKAAAPDIPAEALALITDDLKACGYL